MNVYLAGRVEVRVSPEEAALIAAVERRPSGHRLPLETLKRYRLLIEAIGRVAVWKERKERTKP